MDYSNNYINAEISIKKGQNKKQRLINSYENWKREHLTDWDWDSIISENNEEEVKLCVLYIQTKKLNFTYLYNFEKYGKYQVKFIFKVPIKSINSNILHSSKRPLIFTTLMVSKLDKSKNLSE